MEGMGGDGGVPTGARAAAGQGGHACPSSQGRGQGVTHCAPEDMWHGRSPGICSSRTRCATVSCRWETNLRVDVALDLACLP